MTGTLFKRIGAYILDVFIVTAIVTLLSYVPFLNPSRVQYSEKYNELMNVYEQYTKNEISESEYNEAYIPISYELYRLNTSYIIIDLVIVILYFGIAPFIFKGQTLGKKIMQIKIVSNNDKPLTIVNYLLRMVVLNNVLITIALLSIVYLMSVDNYAGIYQNVNLVGYIITYISLFMIMVRRDGRGLHDFVANTKVVLTNEEIKRKLDAIEEEQRVLEKEMEIEKEPKKKEEKVINAKTKKASKKKEDTK